MAEYIERETADKALTVAAANDKDKNRRTWAKAICVLHDLPAADAAPVVHGRWIKHTKIHGFVYCSACRDVYLDAEWLKDGKWGYCPNCGARMDGDSDGQID